MTTNDEDKRFEAIIAADDPDFLDILDALELIMERLRRIERMVDDLDSGEDIG